MPIDLDSKLVETASKIVASRNEYGDIVYGSSTSTNCLYRDISSLQRTSNTENVRIDGLLWFSASEDVNRGDIYYHTSEGYLRIIKVIRAKRLVADASLQFIKCEVAKQNQIS